MERYDYFSDIVAGSRTPGSELHTLTWEFPKIRGVPHSGVLMIRVLLFRVAY